MPHNKKHHFVPRFYLKNFAENDGRTINIHIFKNDKTVFAGNLYNQCYQNYLYGKDETCEKALGVIESSAGKVISSINNSRFVPRKMTEQYYSLLVFVLFQQSRTLAAGEELNEQLNNFNKNILIDFAEPETSKLGITRDDLEELTIGYEHPELAALGHAAQLIPMAFDLNLKVLEARGPLEFITSDNPVIFYNPFALGAGTRYGSATGLQSKGLQVYLPISSKFTLLYYDAEIYKIGNIKQEIVSIEERDVRSLNFLQLLNATENVYFKSVTMAVEVQKASARASSRRRSNRSDVRTISTSATSEIVHFFRKDIDHKFKTPFFKLRERPPTIWDPRVMGPRNPAISERFDRFLSEMKSGKWKPSDFGKFLEGLQE